MQILGNVPAGFNNVVLDFGFTTGPSGNFTGGSVNDGLVPWRERLVHG